MGQPAVDISGRARLSCRLRAAQWLFKPTNDVDDAGREFLLAQLLTTPLAALMGSFCALTIELVAWHRSGQPIYWLFIAGEVAVAACRVIEWQGRGQRSSTHLPTIDRSVLLSVLWCTLQGLLAFTIISSGDLVLSVLSATLVMAMIGPICARNYAAPRFAFLLVLLCDIPFVTGAVTSGQPWLLVILPITPPFLLGAMQIIMTFHRSMLETLAAQAHARHLAEHDWLTGVLNRQGMDQALSRIVPDAERQMALISIDLDGFKEVNDRFGHGAGDLLLTQVARRLRDALGDDDLLARMGGDEFMVVVRGMVPDQVAPLADRLIAAISRHAYETGQSVPARVGASIGFACLPEDAANTVELRLRADEALYAAKDAGKGVGRRYGRLAAAAPPLAQTA
ncbi:diguanylate cyclase [Sphingobium indicum IP26]|uniref:Diguanylate cyclase n=1 Tax=Sphingobium indicum F2 TaxID=1450518 RepID=A0A8E1C2K6_9SPHN|nr:MULTISPECIES: GGDEF domain-containing protein [Sphingobium]EPR14151.1 diguanylate cyclase [Sphingobium indicum IP26]EPR18376.1 diguanylate cyclase [Sphingobium indicum IP26]EQB03636.1 diguanylate cyclase [Sphingobium sp. HDIP04]KER36337.1 diguanylate cyclase [Sphingobium indicum F2]